MRCVLILCLASFALAQSPADSKTRFLDPPDDAKIMMRWWWFGPSVTEAQLERELRTMKVGGIGGVEVQPTYPLALDDASRGLRNLPFLSPEFLDRLRFTSDKAHELGLRMDLTLGSGWPFGGPEIPVAHAAGRLRFERVTVQSGPVPVPDLSNGEQLIAAFAGGTERELTNIQNGFVSLESGATRPAEIWFFIASRTGMMVKRASLGAEGFVLDHYDPAAAQMYLKAVGEPLLKALPRPPKAVFCDSLEVFGSDWTPDLLDEFRRRRGYDLRPLLPALVSDIGPKTAGIRHDWGRTLTELLEERFLAPMQKWSAAHRVQFRIQNYGIPPAVLSSNAFADLPEGEGHEWKVLRASRWASSASHIYGRPVTSSETWTWLHSPVFRATPLDMKAEADIHFLQGITQLIGHGWPYTSEGVEYPGWRFYASAVFNEKNPWWIAMPDISKYLQRVSYMLRQGEPANDVAVYLPTTDAWSNFTAGKVHMIEALRALLGPDLLGKITDAGYGFDFFDDRILAELGKVEGKRLRLGASQYSAVLVPALDTMPVATLRRLEEFSRAGGIVVAGSRLPSRAPGMQASEAEHAEVRRLAAALKVARDLPSALTPDVAIAPANPEVGFIHRKADGADIYFLANTSNKPAKFTAAFRVGGRGVEALDAVTGRVLPVAPVQSTDTTTTLAVELQPYESRIFLFSGASKPALRPQIAGTAQSLDLSTGWTVAFGGSNGQVLSAFRSWTEDETTRGFSGVATYSQSFDAPASFVANGTTLHLDFGEGTVVVKPEKESGPGMRAWLDAPVREAAVVYVNGQRAGAVWCPPYRLDVTRFVKAGKNDLRIDVGNLAVNHMAARPLPNYRLLNLRYGVRFEAQDMKKIQAQPAGILKPVRLTATNQPST